MPGEMNISQINHLTTMVQDTARAMRFYNDLLGIKQIQSQAPNENITWLQPENGVMTYRIETHDIETPNAPAKPGNLHYAFPVADLEDTKQTLREGGYAVLREGIRYDGPTYRFIADPDGNSVEFCTAAGYASRP